MIDRRILTWKDFGKARFFDVKLEKPEKDLTNITLTDELLAEWDSQATEIVDCEPINNSEGYLGSEEVPLSILRVVHADGRVTIEPVYKLFGLRGKHPLWRNTQLQFSDVEKDVLTSIEETQKSLNTKTKRNAISYNFLYFHVNKLINKRIIK